MEAIHKERKELKQGFTIIEITIVILIAGLIMAGAFGGWKFYQRVKAQQTDSKLMSLDAAIADYKNDIGEYPKDLRELVEGPANPNLRKRWGIAKATEADLRDSWDNEIYYVVNAKGARPPYELYSVGPNGEDRIMSKVSQGTIQL